MKQLQTNQRSSILNFIGKKNLSKSLLITTMMLLQSAIGFSQVVSFNGEWSGNVVIKEKGTTVEKRMVIDGNKVIKYADERYDESWFKEIDFETESHGDNIKIEWTKKSMHGCQAETFDINFVNKDTLKVTWLRKCNVYGSQWQPADEGWETHGSGYLVRAPLNNTIAMGKE